MFCRRLVDVVRVCFVMIFSVLEPHLSKFPRMLGMDVWNAGLYLGYCAVVEGVETARGAEAAKFVKAADCRERRSAAAVKRHLHPGNH